MNIAKAALANVAMNHNNELTNVAMNHDDVILFINGLMTVLVKDDNLEAVDICVQDIDGLDMEIAQAVTDFKSGGVHGIMEGIKLIGEVLAQAKGDEVNCKDMANDWARIEEWAKIFHNPSQLLQTVVVGVMQHKAQITSEISELKADEKSGNFKDLGMTVANLIVNVLGEIPQSGNPMADVDPVLLEAWNKMMLDLTKEEILLFINGLMTGLVQDDDLEKVEICVKDTESLEPTIIAALADLKKGGIHNIIEGAKEIGEVLAAA